MTPDARSWLTFVVMVLVYFFYREARALIRNDDERFTLSTYIHNLQRAMGLAGGKALAGVIILSTTVYLVGHFVTWVW